MGDYVSWICSELERRYPKFDSNVGVDLNRNGRIEPNERLIDANKNDEIGDHDDWVAFLKKNSLTLKRLGGIFDWGTRLKPDNPIHDLLFLEKEFSSDQEIRKAYEILNQIVAKVKQRLAGGNYGPSEKLLIVHTIVEKMGFRLSVNSDGSPETWLLSKNISSQTISSIAMCFIMLSVGHEMGWPLHPVDAFARFIVRWDDGKNVRFNYDEGKIESDKVFINKYNISREAVENEVFMKSLNREELLSTWFLITAIVNLKNNRNSEANVKLNVAILLNPQNIRALVKRGELRLKTHNVEGALKDFRAAYDLDSSSEGAMQGLIYVYHRKGDHRNTLKFCNQAIKQRRSAEYFLFRAMAQLQLNDPIHALKDVEKAMLMKPDSYDAFITKVKILQSLNRHESAGKILSRVIKAIPSRAEPRWLRGLSYEALNKHDEAFKDFDSAMNLADSSNIKPLQYRRIRVLLSLGRLKQAKEDCDKAIASDPKNIDIYLLRAEINIALKNYSLSVADCNRVIAMDSENAKAFAYRSVANSRLGRGVDARRDVKRSSELNPRSHETRFVLSKAAAEQGAYSEALFQINHALRLAPNNGSYLFIRGTFNYKLGKFYEAISDFTRAHEKHNIMDHEILCWRGMAYLAQGKVHEAIRDFNSVVEVDKNNHQALKMRGKAYLAIHLYDKALADFNSSLSVKPGDSETMRMMNSARRARKNWRRNSVNGRNIF